MVETVEICQVMWFVMLESVKDRVIEVDTQGQHVLPHVQYGTTGLLIRDVVGSVACLNEWKIGIVTHLGSHGARGVVVPCTTPGNLSIAMVPCTTLAKPGVRPIVNICKDIL
jgi:hypothetical protein